MVKKPKSGANTRHQYVIKQILKGERNIFPECRYDSRRNQFIYLLPGPNWRERDSLRSRMPLAKKPRDLAAEQQKRAVYGFKR